MRTIEISKLKNAIEDDIFNCASSTCKTCIFLLKGTNPDCGGHNKHVRFSKIKETNFGVIKNVSIKTLKRFLITYKVEDYQE